MENVQYSLRGYQEKIVQSIGHNFRKGTRRPIIQLPTGAGKGLIMSHIVSSALKKNKRVLTVLYGSDLLEQTRRNYLKYHNIDSGIIQGSRSIYDLPSTIASISTLARRLEKGSIDLSNQDILIVDEAHNTVSNSYKKLFQALSPKTLAIGWTATPYAIGNKYLPFWDAFIKGATYQELVDQGFLVPYKYYAPKSQIDTSGIKTSKGDYDQKELYNRAQDKYIVGDVVDTYKRLGENRGAFLFAINREHSEMMAKAFNEAGIPSAYADGTSPPEIRNKALNDLKTGKIKVLCNVNIFSTGIDVPEASVLISVRPTQSLVLWSQQVGRVLRPAEGKKNAIFLDHSSNYTRHGMVGADHEPELEFLRPKGKGAVKKKAKTVQAKLCPECQAVCLAQTVTCDCGYIFKSKQDIAQKFVDGKLVEIQPDEFKAEAIVNEFVRLEGFRIHRGFKENWVWFKLAEKYPVHLLRKIFKQFPKYVR